MQTAGVSKCLTRSAPPTPIQPMGVEHGRSHVFVPEQFLNGSNIVPILKHMSGKRVPERVTGGVLDDPCLVDGVLDHSLGCHATARLQPPECVPPVSLWSIDISSFAGGEPLTVMEQIPPLRRKVAHYQEILSDPLDFDIGHGQSLDQVLGRMSTDKPLRILPT